jgi:putative two-component system response regulator
VIDPERIRASRLMIVDDQESNVLLLEKLLQAEGYANLVSTSDPTLVKDLYRGFKPDLLLLDLHMPGLDGFAVMERLKAGLGEDYLPILVLTADVTRSTRIRALEAGAKDFLTKPLDPLEVVHRVRNLLEVRLLYADMRNQNAILEEKVRERTMELAETRLEIIHRLGRAAEFRDEGTGLHLMRISQFAVCLARAAGLPSETVDLIFSASPMHDIGKIGIPDRILFKEGKLDDEEWAVMRTHTTIGADLLSGHDSPLMKTAALIALTHHERWDGGGYPNGLKGEDIPMEGRVVALCDVFDALISRRPYKDKWPTGKAVMEIDSESGGAFDPFFVAKFHEALNEVQSIFHSLEMKVPPEYRHGLS